MKLVNLCPHDIVLRLSKNKRITLPYSGNVARVKFDSVFLGTYNGIPIHERIVREVNSLPNEKSGVVYVVSSLLQENVEERQDVVSPDRYDAFISDNGRVLEVSKLVKFKH